MKKILTTIFTIVICFSFYQISAQKCKPDISTVDKIEKKKITAWSGELYQTSSGAVIVGSTTSTMQVTLMIGIEQDSVFLTLFIKKAEGSKQNASFESALKAVKGNEFMFGIKDGEALKFTANDVSNNTKMDNFWGELATTIALGTYIPKSQLPSFIETLSTKIIDAFRVKLDNNLIITQSVKGKNGEKMKNKAICLKNYLQENGLLK